MINYLVISCLFHLWNTWNYILFPWPQPSTFMKLFDIYDRSDVLKWYSWIYSPRRIIRKAPSRPNFLYFLYNFPSYVICSLMANIVNNTKKNTKLLGTSENVIFSFVDYTLFYKQHFYKQRLAEIAKKLSKS